MGLLRIWIALPKLAVLIALTCLTQAHSQVTYNLTRGWNLLGNSSNAPITVATTFGDPNQATSVWKWNRTGNKWAFYTPLMSPAALITYAGTNNFDVLTGIAPKEGFWVNSATTWSISGPIADPVTLAASDLQLGWNLVSSADGMTPSQLNASSLGGNLSSAGKEINTIWAWDAGDKEWRFYSPSLENQGGTALADYISSKGYLGFTSPLAPAEGFWFHISPSPTVPDPPTIRAATAGNGQVTVSFAAPANDGGRTISGYTVTSSPAGGVDVNAGTTSLSHVVTGLTNGITYTFTVTAHNSLGDGAPSASNLATPSLTPPSAPVVSLVQSRTSGVAPLAVFFDASATTDSAVTTKPFHELEYRWTFGDPKSGTWNYGAVVGLSRNSATGPVAAHVFETPGIYTVTLLAVDGANTASATAQITVDDPDVVFAGVNTICVAATSDPTPGTGGCPTGAAHFQQSNWPTIVNTYAKTGRRVLLQRGDTFTGPATAQLSTAGPGIIGAFGTGPKPVIQTTSTTNYSNILALAGSLSDWRLMDLDFDGQSDIHREAIASGGNAILSRILMLRLSAHDLGGAIELAIGTSSTAVPDQIALVDSVIQRLRGSGSTSTTHGILLGASQAAIMGNLFDDSWTPVVNSAEHMIRIAFMDRGVISSNQIQVVGQTKEMLTLRAPCQSQVTPSTAPCLSNNYFPIAGLTGANAITRKVIISDNYIKQNTGVGIQVKGVTTQDEVGFRDIIIERNFVQSQVGWTEPPEGISISMGAVSVTVRNNLIDSTNGTGNHLAITVGTGAADQSPSPDQVWIYHNSHYDNSAASGIVTVRVRTGSTNVVARNNLAYAPSGTSTLPVLLSDSTGAVSAGGNSTNSQVRNTSPSWATAPPVIASDWKPTGNSYAIGTNNGCSGAPCSASAGVPVWSDFFRATLPSPRDIGAVAH